MECYFGIFKCSWKTKHFVDNNAEKRACTSPAGSEPTSSRVLGAGTNKFSKNKLSGWDWWSGSSGLLEAGPPIRLCSTEMLLLARRSLEFQRVEGVQCYLCLPGSLTNSTLVASWMSQRFWACFLGKLRTKVSCMVGVNMRSSHIWRWGNSHQRPAAQTEGSSGGALAFSVCLWRRKSSRRATEDSEMLQSAFFVN